MSNGRLEFLNDRRNPFGEIVDTRTSDVFLTPHKKQRLKIS
jgi:hypothetical protein